MDSSSMIFTAARLHTQPSFSSGKAHAQVPILTRAHASSSLRRLGGRRRYLGLGENQVQGMDNKSRPETSTFVLTHLQKRRDI